MKLKERIGKEINRANSQIEAYEANLKLVSGPASTSFKAYLGKIKRDMFDINTSYKGLENEEHPVKSKGSSKKDKDTEGTLFGRAGEREHEEEKVDLGEMQTKQVIQMGDSYQDKTAKVVENIGKQVKHTQRVADDVIVIF